MPLLIQSLHQLCFRIAKAKTFQADKPLPARWTDGGMLDIRAALDRIAMPPQRFQKRVIGQTSGQRRVNVAANEVAQRIAAALSASHAEYDAPFPTDSITEYPRSRLTSLEMPRRSWK